MESRKVNGKKYRITSVCIGVILALALGEGALRVYKFKKYSTGGIRIAESPRLVFEHRPSVKFVNRYGVEMAYNSLGFIGEETGPKKEGVFRILSVGDSIAAGEYLPESERYVNLAAGILSGRVEKKIEVINAGVAGYNSWQELELMKTKGLALEPDLIVVSVCLNDDSGYRPQLKRTWFGGVREIPEHHKKAKHFNFLYQRIELYRYLYDFLYTLKRIYSERGDYFDIYKRYETDEYVPDFKRWKEPLEGMIVLAKRNNKKIIFVIFPFEQQVMKAETVSFAPLTDFLREQGMYFLDLITEFNRNNGQKLYIARDPIHPNELGSGLAARALADYIITKKILKQR